uniref:Uncharacterized protein n=1 Tax=Arundo donax TaxID=35708 RepID=A0A0A9FS04_ARUDO
MDEKQGEQDDQGDHQRTLKVTHLVSIVLQFYQPKPLLSSHQLEQRQHQLHIQYDLSGLQL